MAKLYEIAGEYLDFIEDLWEEISEEAIKKMKSIKDEMTTKMSNMVKARLNYLAEADALDTEITRLTERKKAKKNKVDSIKNYLSFVLTKLWKKKLELDVATLSFRKKPVSVKIAEWVEFDEKFYIEKAPLLSKTLIKEALVAGEEINWAILMENEQTFMIK